MPDLRLLILTADAERFRGALTVAAAEAALGREVSIFLQLDAVALLDGRAAPEDARHRAAGLPTVAQLMDDAQSLGVGIIACQSGLALCGLSADALDERIAVSGPLAFLKETDGRLLLV